MTVKRTHEAVWEREPKSLKRAYDTWPERLAKNLGMLLLAFATVVALVAFTGKFENSLQVQVTTQKAILLAVIGCGLPAMVYVRQLAREVRALRHEAAPAIEALSKVKPASKSPKPKSDN